MFDAWYTKQMIREDSNINFFILLTVDQLMLS